MVNLERIKEKMMKANKILVEQGTQLRWVHNTVAGVINIDARLFSFNLVPHLN